MNGTSHLAGVESAGRSPIWSPVARTVDRPDHKGVTGYQDPSARDEDGILHWTSRRNCGGTGSASVESASFSHPPTSRGYREVKEMEDIGDILDLDRYPLDRPASPRGRALVAECRAALDRDGLFNLEGLMRPAAVARCVADLKPLMETASFRHARSHNVYFLDRVEGAPEDHPALRRFETVNRTLCDDRMTGAAVHRIYEWTPLAGFLSRVLRKPRLYLMDDPLARANIMSYHHGEALNWHFDRSEFTTTLLLQAPDAGGEFQYRSGLRTPADPNPDGVARLLDGRDPEVRSLTLAAGTLNVFKGRNTAHRTSPVIGPRERMIAVFSYYERPGVLFSDEERIGFYGRAE